MQTLLKTGKYLGLLKKQVPNFKAFSSAQSDMQNFDFSESLNL
jgi:hypothetical protein